MHAPSRFANVLCHIHKESYALLHLGFMDQQDTYELGRTKCDLSVVSDLKTDRAPCCFRQRQSGSDNPLMLMVLSFSVSIVHVRRMVKLMVGCVLIHVSTEKPLIRY